MDSESNDDNKATGGQPNIETTEVSGYSEVEVSGALLVIRAFREPQLKAVFDIGADYVAPVLGPIKEIEVHAYDQFSNHYYAITRRAHDGHFITDPVTFESGSWRRKGPNALHYRYRQLFGWSEWYDTGWFYLTDRPVIYRPTTVYTSSFVTIRGGAEPYSNVLLSTQNGVVWGDVSIPASGGFSIGSKKLDQSNYSMSAVCYVPGYRFGVYSDIYDFSVILPPVISGITPPNSSHPVIFGSTGLPGATIDVRIRDTDIYLFKDALVDNSGNWRATSTYTFQAIGSYPLVACQRLRGTVTDAGPVLIYSYRLPPIILGPAPLQGQSFILEGNRGLEQAQLKVYRDQENSPVYGTGMVTEISGSWTVQVSKIPPGPISLVVEQYVPAYTVRSEARLFKIRPPKLEQPTIVFPNDTSVKFSGKGHYDPARPTRIQFIVESGQGTAPPVAIVKADCTWETTATGWELGIRTLVITQQIADSPSGWIDSLPCKFTVNKVLPDITDVQYTQDYQPTFTGQGFNGATVQLRKPNSGDFEAPPADVAGGQWSSTASTVWGPSFERQVHIKQYLGDQSSPTWFVLKVIIPPLAPGVDAPPEEGLTPTFSGSCWPDAVVKIKFSDSEAIFDATVSGDIWSFKRPDPFTGGVTYTIEAIQAVAGQPSEPACRTFSVYRELLQPVIKTPLPDEETDSDLTVTGDNGLSGASMQLWDARDNKSLGSPVILVEDGLWSIALSGLAVDRWYISAQQTLNNRPSEHSDVREFNVVVMPPEFCNPLPDSDLPRTSTLSGKGRPGALVTVWSEGLAEPLLRDVLIGPNGFWDGSVTLAVGDKVIWANQTFEGKTSKPSPEVSCRFVPHAVLPESPTPQEHLGNAVTVSGFAVPGDQITLMRGATELGQTPVLADGSWSITATLEPPDGAVTLSTVASCGEFPSAPSEWVSQVGLYLPAFTKPEAGHWVSPMVTFTGLGNPGVGKLMAWYNPDVVLAASVTVTAAGWMARPPEPLAGGAQWCRFEQTFSTGTPISDCSESGRFDVGGETSGDS
ncbi:hypothetical protein [Pseudomonas neuropathica]|uniref:hypothetical protein n=1 Tax=Pseudomonas neuropathica TaxID=2730425 RepID=UPI003EB8606C